MTIATDFIALLEAFAARHPLPRIAALHLPPASAAGSKNGEFCALELEDGSLGLSYVLLGDTLAELSGGSGVDRLIGADALSVARWYEARDGVHRTLGFAAINALSRCLCDRAGWRPESTADSLGGLAPQPGDHVGMIGFFTPLIGRIVEAGARLTIAELNPAFAGEHDGYRVTLDATELATCNKILSTSTVLLNDTLDTVLGRCSSATWFAMVGPGAGCLPDPLFARGVTLLGGSWIEDRDAFVAALAAGGSWSSAARKFVITRDDWPGSGVLLGRLPS